jgi:hypothetical protein
MKERTIISRVAMDMFREQLKWSYWFIAIIFLLHNIFSVSLFQFSDGIDNLFAFSYFSTPVYMLVIGIIASSYFMPYYVKHGVTRKGHFIGSALAAFILSASLTIIIGILSLLEGVIYSLLNTPISFESFQSETAYGSFIYPISYILNCLLYYMIGWFIHIGFYRFKWMIGLVFCGLSVLIVSLHGFLWSNGMTGLLGIEELTKNISVPLATSILGTVGIIGILLIFVRLFTRRIAIKI